MVSTPVYSKPHIFGIILKGEMRGKSQTLLKFPDLAAGSCPYRPLSRQFRKLAWKKLLLKKG
jgi:hypothetical protein